MQMKNIQWKNILESYDIIDSDRTLNNPISICTLYPGPAKHLGTVGWGGFFPLAFGG